MLSASADNNEMRSALINIRASNFHCVYALVMDVLRLPLSYTYYHFARKQMKTRVLFGNSCIY